MTTDNHEEQGPSPSEILGWQVACMEADRASPKSGLAVTFTANEAQRHAIAAALDLAACTRLAVTASIRARAGGRYTLLGRIEADVEQACVATLEPVHTRLDEELAAEFSPEEDIAKTLPPETDFDPEGEDEPFAMVAGEVDVGQAVYEHLALSIDPFPRREGAEAIAIEKGPSGPPQLRDADAPGAADPGKPNPFAALAKLKLHKDD